ncbi:MAG TPA: trehalose-6-phosphate synthase [Gammaproteobacteria bacterium]|nr:trehalose-6-phosphate synthase [Gammaproteobacteria bacterium]
MSGAAWWMVTATTHQWFEKDVELRSQLAVTSARPALVEGIERHDLHGLRQELLDISRDERVMAADLCGPDLKSLASTPQFPPEFSCALLGPRVRAAADAPANAWSTWRSNAQLTGGPVHVSAIPLIDGEKVLGFIVLIHDLSFVERREDMTRTFMLSAFGLLALVAAIVTLVAMRLSWKDWSESLRRMALGESSSRPRAFLPLLKDMRELLDRLAAEEQSELQGGVWTPQRLKLTLGRHLHGERLIVVANREPYIHERGADGKVRVLHPASGLVTALEPVMRACSGVWVAHGAGSADRETADKRGHVRVPPGEESYVVRRLWLTPEQERGYYYGFANEGLWALCHVAHNRPTFREQDWRCYQQVNQQFADAVCDEADTDDPVILVQDYHFALLPRMLRERLPRATILTFWHIPWPNAEQMSICPWHSELIQGLLGSSILGFHTRFHCNNFMEAADRFLEARLDREDLAVIRDGRRTLVRGYPISVEWPNQWVKSTPPAAECRATLFAQLGLPPDGHLGLGVDRLDYTKGIEERMLAVERLLEKRHDLHGRFVFLQIASPSRTLIERYSRLNSDVEALVERINGRFGRADWRPIVLKREHTEPADVFRLYRSADFCYVSSLHDGMNLVAKEFIASREDEGGVLVLSQFTGAARELTEALIVNPYDIEEASAALSLALDMPTGEQAARMRAMRTLVSEYNIYRWAGRMLLDASRLRQREQLAGVLSGPSA